MKDHERGKDSSDQKRKVSDYSRKDHKGGKLSRFLPLLVAALLLFLLAAMGVQLKNMADMPKHRRCNSQVCLQAILDGPPGFDNPVQARIVRRKYLTPPSDGPLNLTEDISSQDSAFFNCKDNLMKIIDHKRDGRFVVLGAGDGEFQDLTLDLERNQGWTGLLIEPNPDLFRMLTEKRRNAELCSAAVSPISHPARITMTHPTPSPSLSPHQKMLHYRQAKIKSFNQNLTEPVSRHTVQALTLPAMVFASSTVTDRIDLLVLDMAATDNLVIDQVAWPQLPPIDVIAVSEANSDDSTQLKILFKELSMDMETAHYFHKSTDRNTLIFYKLKKNRT